MSGSDVVHSWGRLLLALAGLIAASSGAFAQSSWYQYSTTVNAFYDVPRLGVVTPYYYGDAGAAYLNAESGPFAGPGVCRFSQFATDEIYNPQSRGTVHK